jgi:hypothetical protein
MPITGDISQNISLWHNDWEEFILSKSLTLKVGDGSVQFHDKMMNLIINLDEIKLSVDCSNGGWKWHCPQQMERP